jgi:hypothetical protein
MDSPPSKNSPNAKKSPNATETTKQIINDMNLDVAQNIDALFANTSIDPAFKAFAIAKADTYSENTEKVVKLISEADMSIERNAWLSYTAYIMIGYRGHAKNVLATIFGADVNAEFEKGDVDAEVEAEAETGEVAEAEAEVEAEAVEGVEGEAEAEVEPVEAEVEPVEAEVEPVEAEVEPVEAEVEPVEAEAVEVEGEAEVVAEEAEGTMNNPTEQASVVPVDEKGTNSTVSREGVTDNSSVKQPVTNNTDPKNRRNNNTDPKNPNVEAPASAKNPDQTGGTRRKSKNIKRKSKKARKVKKPRKP